MRRSTPLPRCNYATYAVEHLLEVLLGVDPAGDGVTEEDEVRDDAARVQGDHVAHAAERRVLLLVVTDVPQRCAPDRLDTGQVMFRWGPGAI